MIAQDRDAHLADDPRADFLRETAPNGRALTELMDGLIRESARQLAYIRGKLQSRADSPRGCSLAHAGRMAQGGDDAASAGQGGERAVGHLGPAGHLRKPAAQSRHERVKHSIRERSPRE
jgi:hypothetical protein